MKKEELLAAGVPEESIKAVQRLHGLDMQKLMEKHKLRITADQKASETRSAILKMTYLLSGEDIQRLLVFANELYAKSVTNKEKVQ